MSRIIPYTTHLALAILVLSLMACATVDSPGRTQVHLKETDEGKWLVTFQFPESQSVVVFRQSPEPYRASGWTALSEGVEVVTIGQTDVMLFAQPSRTATFEIAPYTVSLEKAYTPFLAFTDGSWGVLEGQFRVSSAPDRQTIETFDGNGESWNGEQLDYTLTVESPRRIFHNGEWAEGTLRTQPQGDGSYIYVGDAAIQRSDNFVGFIDDGLPEWVRNQLDSDLSTIFGELSTEWGLTLDEPVEILFVFDGATSPGLSQTGGAIKRQIALQVSGQALLEPDPTIADFFRWFLTHESVHVYQAAAGMRDIPSEHAWMHEGVANTMAHRIGARLASDKEAFLNEVYPTAFADCVDYLKGGAPLSEALKTGQFGAYYGCGDLISLITEAELDEGDIFDFWKRFLAEARTQYDGAISIDLYFQLAKEAGLSEDTARQLRAFVEQPVSQPQMILSAMLKRAGLAPQFNHDGKLQSLELPD
jgi:hypothetical protein